MVSICHVCQGNIIFCVGILTLYLEVFVELMYALSAFPRGDMGQTAAPSNREEREETPSCPCSSAERILWVPHLVNSWQPSIPPPAPEFRHIDHVTQMKSHAG